MQYSNWERYVENTVRIRALSSPGLHPDMDGSYYHETLMKNFIEIRSLAMENRDILNNEIYPVLVDNGELLDEEIVSEMKEFQNLLMDAYNMENIDMTLVVRIADRLYADAKRKQDTAYLIEQLDAQVSSHYMLLNMQKRILPYNMMMCEESRKKGFEAGEEVLSYLDKEKFATLPDEASKELVLINSRYMIALYEGMFDEASRLRILQLLRASLELEKDEFYRQQAPGYDWKYHRLRTLEYFAIIMECGNKKGLTVKESEEAWTHCNELLVLWRENPELEEFVAESEIMVGIYRSAYFANKIGKEEYKRKLLDEYARRPKSGYGINEIYSNVIMPLEYILLMDPQDMSEEEEDNLGMIYRNLQNYVFGIPNSGSFSYLLEYYIEVLNNFIEIPGQVSFKDACLDGIAALHPPTYVHTIMVGRIAKCFCKNLIRLHPEAFVGVLGLKDVESVKKNRFMLESFIYEGALCHDFGKIPVIDTVFNYGRNLTEDEFDLIRSHPGVCAWVLERYDSTKAYTDIAKGHHRWYDNSHGYPEYDTSLSELKVMIDLVACADCLDAATDSVGRSYNTEKNCQEVFEELMSESGTRYTPYIVELLQDSRTKEDVEYLIKEGRKDVYFNTFLRLMNVQRGAQYRKEDMFHTLEKKF